VGTFRVDVPELGAVAGGNSDMRTMAEGVVRLVVVVVGVTE
jgi:hypothetical protein